MRDYEARTYGERIAAIYHEHVVRRVIPRRWPSSFWSNGRRRPGARDSASPSTTRCARWSRRSTSSSVSREHRSFRPAFVTPGSELDLMARLAGLRLRDRWADRQREPFDGTSRGHVSVYEHG